MAVAPLKLGLCFVLGIVLTVGVSWGIKFFHYWRFYPSEWVESGSFYIESGGNDWHTLYYRGSGRASYRVRPLSGTPEDDSAELQGKIKRMMFPNVPHPPNLPFEVIVNDVPQWVELPGHETGIYALFSTAYGWPFVAMMSQLQNPESTGSLSSWSWSPTDWRPVRKNSFGTSRRALTPLDLPQLPLWRWFILDTVFYATLSWLLLFAPRVLKRLIRHRQGKCRFCGYSLAGLSSDACCPECGRTWPTAQRTRVRS